ncbi:MAG TPA: hypothetical protein VND15_01510 [Candidatus Acidoferrales bacterium]|nr:hypothetical protein [Candidatus Acidoferrales bacterium]
MGKSITEQEKKDYFQESLRVPDSCMKGAALAAERFIDKGMLQDAVNCYARARLKAKECGDISRAHLQKESKTESEYRKLEAQYTTLMMDLRFKMMGSVPTSLALVPAPKNEIIPVNAGRMSIVIRKAETA